MGFERIDERLEAHEQSEMDAAREEQLKLWVEGTPEHCDATGECCPDFSCCKPELLASEDERRVFAEAVATSNEDLKMQMLGNFLRRAFEKHRVHVAGEDTTGNIH